MYLDEIFTIMTFLKMCSSFRLKRVNDELTGHEKIESFYGSNKKRMKNNLHE